MLVPIIITVGALAWVTRRRRPPRSRASEPKTIIAEPKPGEPGDTPPPGAPPQVAVLTYDEMTRMIPPRVILRPQDIMLIELPPGVGSWEAMTPGGAGKKLDAQVRRAAAPGTWEVLVTVDPFGDMLGQPGKPDLGESYVYVYAQAWNDATGAYGNVGSGRVDVEVVEDFN